MKKLILFIFLVITFIPTESEAQIPEYFTHLTLEYTGGSVYDTYREANTIGVVIEPRRNNSIGALRVFTSSLEQKYPDVRQFEAWKEVTPGEQIYIYQMIVDSGLRIMIVMNQTNNRLALVFIE